VGIVICAKNALLKDGSKSNWIDRRKLAAGLRRNQLKPEYHKEHWREFLDRHTPVRRYNVSAALKIETGGGLAS